MESKEESETERFAVSTEEVGRPGSWSMAPILRTMANGATAPIPPECFRSFELRIDRS
jgi:hypothetical protein